jgi:HAD superfamily hydrolase (TIGR01509 family)
VRAVLFDFNGTLSDDEELLRELFGQLLAERGLQLDADTYYAQLAGLPDPQIVARIFELQIPNADPVEQRAFLAAKVARYKCRIEAEPCIGPGAVAAVEAAAETCTLGVVTGALREEVEHALALAGIRERFAVLVAIDDGHPGKPAPDCFLAALAQINAARAAADAIEPHEVLVVEDSRAGVAAAKAAGMHCAVIAGAAYAGAPVAADVVIERLDAPTLLALLAA